MDFIFEFNFGVIDFKILLTSNKVKISGSFLASFGGSTTSNGFVFAPPISIIKE